MKCPQCGTEMTPSPSPDKTNQRMSMVKHGANAAYSENFLDVQLAKQNELGVVQTCPNCRYVTREKANGASEPKQKVRG